MSGLKHRLPTVLAALCATAMAGAAAAVPLTVAKRCGGYQTTQQNAYAPGFPSETTWMEYCGGPDEIRSQVQSGDVEWDIADVLAQDARIGCDEGLFLRLPKVLFSKGMARDLVIEQPPDCVGPNIIW